MLALSLLLSACASNTQMRPDAYSFSAANGGETAFNGWFEPRDLEEDAPLDKRVELAQSATAEQRFAAAEVAYFDGDIEYAAELYMQLLKRSPSHALNRFASARLYALRHKLVDFNNRIRPILADIQFKDVAPLTRIQLSKIAQSVHYQDWRISDSEQPFSADSLGFPTRWTTSPALSSWRLTDLDKAFLPETEDALRDAYLAPAIAEDKPINYVKSRPFSAPGINLSPDFDRSGIYYMETFARIEPGDTGSGAAERDFLVYADFSSAAKLWIDGKLILSRDEKDYQSGERVRRIRLGSGVHRILVKLAYQNGYRDSFDMALLADDATPLDASGLNFDAKPPKAQKGSIKLLAEQKRPAELEPTRLSPQQIKDADDISLYLALSSAIMDLEAHDFDVAWKELMRRHPKFAVGYMLRARQLRTLWEVPSQIRNARSLADLRRASKLAPHNLSNNLRLGARLREQGKSDDELQDLLKNNRDRAFTETGELQTIVALREWASFLEDQGWSESAETGWQRVLDAAPTECGAANSLQSLYYARNFYPPLDKITTAHAQCPGLTERLVTTRNDQDEARLALARKDAARYPYRSSAQERYSDELLAQGQPEKAHQVIVDARDRMPWDANIWYDLAKDALAKDGLDAARTIIEKGIDQHEDTPWLHWRLAMLENRVPLASLMHDGLKIAQKEVAHGTEKLLEKTQAPARSGHDEAYYALDYAVRKYFDDGSAVTLTHNIIRVMTKGGIDRFGEFVTPSGAELVLARTIKKDGSVRVPERTAGKSTLSMPGLAPGDFVETAYIQYSSASALSKTRQRGIRFFFRMAQISSQHSEYIVINPRGDFQRMNDAPELQTIETSAGPGVQFLRTQSPRPRSEPSSVSADEYLPWIQMHREGTTVDDFEVARRNIVEQIRDSSKTSDALKEQIKIWREGLEPGSKEEVKQLFYRVSAWFADPTLNRFNTDATHALLEHDGNPLLVLKAAYDEAEIPAEIYLAKSEFQSPHVDASGEFSKYTTPFLKVEMPDKTHAWLSPDSPDAMFNSAGQTLLDHPAICVSCDDPRAETVAPENPRPLERHVQIDGSLDAAGTLNATATITYRGALAALVRQVLRRNADPSSRKKFADMTISNLLPGATLQSYTLVGTDKPDEDFVMEAKFKRTNFARRVAPDQLQIQTELFDDKIAQHYAELSQRETPLFVPLYRNYDYALAINFPANTKLTLHSRQGPWEYKSEFGTYTRAVESSAHTLNVKSSLEIPVQRIAPEAYPKFREWAQNLDQSALLFLRISTAK